MSAKPKKAKPPKAEASIAVHPAVEAGPTPVPPQINDVRDDDAPVLGHFVDIVEGEHEGRYGVFVELAQDGETAVVRTRDAESERITTPLSTMRPAEAGRR